MIKHLKEEDKMPDENKLKEKELNSQMKRLLRLVDKSSSWRFISISQTPVAV